MGTHEAVEHGIEHTVSVAGNGTAYALFPDYMLRNYSRFILRLTNGFTTEKYNTGHLGPWELHIQASKNTEEPENNFICAQLHLPESRWSNDSKTLPDKLEYTTTDGDNFALFNLILYIPPNEEAQQIPHAIHYFISNKTKFADKSPTLSKQLEATPENYAQAQSQFQSYGIELPNRQDMLEVISQVFTGGVYQSASQPMPIVLKQT